MPFSPKKLRDQVIVVTGATSGIGLATARALGERGARLMLSARDGQALADVVAGIEAKGGQASFKVADVGRRNEVDALAEAAVAAYGGIDTWINVAGQSIYGLLWEVSDADHEKLVQTNFWGTVYGSLIAVKHLRGSGGGLINVGSVASDISFPMQGMYCATKHAILGFTDSLRMELVQEGVPIAVTLIKPTSINTPLPQRARNYMDREPTLPPLVYAPEEVARAIVHAAERPQREIYVGGTGKLLTMVGKNLPGLLDMVAPLVTANERRREAPRAPAGTLHEPSPSGSGDVRGDNPRTVRRKSYYTRAETHPISAAVSAAGASVTALVANVARRYTRR